MPSVAKGTIKDKIYLKYSVVLVLVEGTRFTYGWGEETCVNAIFPGINLAPH